jgi:hypothetical protein
MSHGDASVSWRRPSLIEALLIAAIGLYALVFVAVLGLEPYPAGSIFGWNVASDGITVTYVTPGSSVANAGIRVGDRVEWASLPLLMRTNLGEVEPTGGGGSATPVTILHGNTRRTVTLQSKPWPSYYQTAIRIQIVVIFVLCTIALALVWLRPSLMTWGFALYEVFGQTAQPIAFAQSSALRFLLIYGALAVFSGASLAGLLIFVSRFPTNRTYGARRIFERLAIPLGLAVALLALIMDILIVVSPAPPPWWLTYTNLQVVPALDVIIALVALLVAARLTSGSERQRVIPLLAAVAFSVAVTATNNILIAFITGGDVFTVLQYLVVFAQLLIAAAVAHGVIKHHVFDISFTLSRTLVYSIITTIIVGTFVLIDFASGKLLGELRIAIALEVAAALIFGLTLNALLHVPAGSRLITFRLANMGYTWNDELEFYRHSKQEYGRLALRGGHSLRQSCSCVCAELNAADLDFIGGAVQFKMLRGKCRARPS